MNDLNKVLLQNNMSGLPNRKWPSLNLKVQDDTIIIETGLHSIACISAHMWSVQLGCYDWNKVQMSLFHFQYYYNSATAQYLYWNAEKQQYIPVAADG